MRSVLMLMVFGFSSIANAAYLKMAVQFKETYVKLSPNVYQLSTANTKVISKLKLSPFTIFPLTKKKTESAELKNKRIILDDEKQMMTFQILDSNGDVAYEEVLDRNKQGRLYQVDGSITETYVQKAYVKNPMGEQFTRFLVDDFYRDVLEIDIESIRCVMELDFRNRTMECSQWLNFVQDL